MQTGLLLTIGFVIFGPNVAQLLGKRDSRGTKTALDAALVASMAILGTDWIFKVLLLPQPGLLPIAMDAAMVRKHHSSPSLITFCLLMMASF